ncbi:Rieske (2Fe-2S) protein [Streptomyces sp. 5-8]|uniref:Cytochrome bc1 complex Rieske iron-sulfur subunit n=1 Tax=Streptomyces musisoli TaxID=2802280 RepID=A0ABS1PD43_9ACTN|nr:MULTISPECIES: Rieske (2Fe-2S) protein [Streptomyces]MBL1109945.1 Rieske (2Fe-2S) protein [Streptomyces musisoli]MBY8846936.1 Rieske (2Fe-2S) protein [Streptomyces sp. SP2-10]
MTSASLPTSSEQGGAPTRPARRTVMAAAGAAGLAAALTACGSGDDSSDTVVSGAGSPGSAGSAQEGGGSAGGTALAKTADIPEGGGKIFKDQGVVVTQPTAGTYKAFSSKCTHQGCAVGSVADGVIVCPCHNSHFSAEDGSVKKGPATRPLAAAKISVSGDEIKLA